MPSARSTTVRDLRRSNRSRTLWALYLHGPLTYQEVATATGVSLATVSNVIGDLLRTGAVVEVGSEGSNGGRPRGLFHIRSDFGYVLGVDVGETAVMVELFDLGMRALASHRSLTRHSRLDPDEVVEQVIEGIEAVVAESDVDESDVLGVGVGVPGLVERRPADVGAHDVAGATEAVVYDQSIGWGTVPIERMLRDRTALPLVVDNGANTLGQAERWFGAAKDRGNAIIVLLGAGVGASIVSTPDGDTGAFAAELGHTKVVAGGRECVCGAKGCLEAYAGADAIVSRYDHLKRRTRAADPREVEERTLAILAAADSDHVATQVVDELVEYLGVGLGNLVNLFTPERIVIGGWLGHALDDSVLPRIRAAVGENALARPFERLDLVRAQLGTDAVALGAATLPVAEFLHSGGVRARSAAATHPQAAEPLA
ncbi:ROK family transcriptional regulator [Humibacter sp. RRB41]|uniref:ROK family transcriptional regulator n=1 Tax=Humibacter sp. RRB41 TaxID=2919946 RepID=UPI001FA9DBD8|nr:ROK family transcriptional regulator [Humibacter sp. RRB41]